MTTEPLHRAAVQIGLVIESARRTGNVEGELWTSIYEVEPFGFFEKFSAVAQNDWLETIPCPNLDLESGVVPPY